MSDIEGLLKGLVYLLNGIAAMAVAICSALHLGGLRGGRRRKVVRGIFLVSLAVGTLSLWFAWSRFHGRPDWMDDTDLPSLARLIGMAGFCLLLWVYFPRQAWLRWVLVLASAVTLAVFLL